MVDRKNPGLLSRREAATLIGMAVAAILWPCQAQAQAQAQAVGVAGDLVTCIRHHPIARLSRSLSPGDPLGLSAFGEWRIAVPASLASPPPCPRCGVAWFQTTPYRRVYVNGKGWLPAS